jgi:hypothetical protein
MYFAAAAVLVLLLLTPFAVSRWFQGRQPGVETSLSGIDTLSDGERAGVHAALQAGVAELPASSARLSAGSDVLMGGSPPEGFRLIAPLQTVTVSDRPVFQWEPLTGAAEYAIAVFDADLRQVAGVAGVMATVWTPPQPLARGQSYAWQVTARRGRESVTVPAPPAPVARFSVMEEKTAATIQRISRAYPQSHLLLGILETQAGARTEAALHLSQVPDTDSYAALARRTLERLQVSAIR